MATKFFFLCHVNSHISGFISSHFYSFSTQILMLVAFLLLKSCLLLLVLYTWLKAGVPVAAGIPTVANIPAVLSAVAGVS